MCVMFKSYEPHAVGNDTRFDDEFPKPPASRTLAAYDVIV